MKYLTEEFVEPDIAKLQLENAALKEDNDRLRAVIDNDMAVIYIKDLQNRYLLINCRYEMLFHIDRQTITGKTDHDIFPKEMADAFQANDRKALEAGAPLEFEEAVPHDDGIHTYISIKFPLFDSSGAVYGVCGISTDISERKKAEVRLQENGERFNSIMQMSVNAIILADSEGNIILWNRSAQKIFGYSEPEIMGKNLTMLMPERYNETHRIALMKASLSSKLQHPEKTYEFYGLRKDGREVPIEINISLWNMGKRIFFTGILRDITERKMFEEDLHRLAITDSLTGIFNRRKMYELLAMETNRVMRYKIPLSLIMIDIDNFKRVNDIYGHSAGDYALVTVVNVLKKHLRDTDYFCRWGGEEFLILTPETEMEEASKLAERLRVVVENYKFEKIDSMTLSLGVTGFKQEDNMDHFLARTDSALYKAKNNGRNRVEVINA